jgi:hypothetical protein
MTFPVSSSAIHKTIGNLTGETRIPERREELWRRLLSHDLDDSGSRDKAGARKSFQNCIDWPPCFTGPSCQTVILDAKTASLFQFVRSLAKVMQPLLMDELDFPRGSHCPHEAGNIVNDQGRGYHQMDRPPGSWMLMRPFGRIFYIRF